MGCCNSKGDCTLCSSDSPTVIKEVATEVATKGAVTGAEVGIVVAATTAGTVVAGPIGTAIGVAIGLATVGTIGKVVKPPAGLLRDLWRGLLSANELLDKLPKVGLLRLDRGDGALL